MNRTLVEWGLVDQTAIDQALPPGGEDKLRSWFTDAGLPHVTCQLIEAVVDLPPLRDYLPGHLRALPWSASFFALDSARQQAVLDQMVERLHTSVTDDGGVRAPFRSFLLSAPA